MDRSETYLTKKLAHCDAAVRIALAERRTAKAALIAFYAGREAHLVEAVHLAQETLNHYNAREALLTSRQIYDGATASRTYRAVLALNAAQTALDEYKGSSTGSGTGATCPQCQSSFRPARSDQRYCSKPCKNLAAVNRYRAKTKGTST